MARLNARAFQRFLVAWQATASLDDLLQLRAPKPTEVDVSQEAHLNDDGEITWLVERFSETYLSSWSLGSLMREWEYVHALRAGCCPPAVMRERRIAEEALARSLADSARLDWSHREGEVGTKPRIEVAHFSTVALRNLAAGRRADAVGLYRGLAELRPNDEEVANNLGFCQIPDDPAGAITSFQRALALQGASPRAMTYCNLALAKHQVDDQKGALAALTDAVALENRENAATMWSLDGRWKPTVYEAVLVYARELEAHILECRGCETPAIE